MSEMKSQEKNYLIFGAGASGLSVVEYCLHKGENIRVLDTRDIPPNAAAIKSLLSNDCIAFGEIKQQWINDADVIVLSPGVSPDLPEIKQAIEQGKEVIGDIEIFARNVHKPYIAVTGSNGKSTVTMLVVGILESQGLNAKACANIGEPALNVINDDVDVFVLELSSFQLETCASLAPMAAAVLNVTDDHLDRHGSYERYAQIKTSIYNNARHKIIPRNAYAEKFVSEKNSVTSFGIDKPINNQFGIIEDDAGRWLVQGQDKIMASSELPLLGVSGELNVLAALALTDALVSDQATAVAAIKKFQGLAHRCELVIVNNGVTWIDDSKGTNVGATVSAINGLDQPLILILGGVYKGGQLSDLCEISRQRVKHVIAFGQDKQVFIDALNGCVNVQQADTLSECVDLAYQLASPGFTVLFSPACASFDMFANYVERGLAFKQLVREKQQDVSNG